MGPSSHLARHRMFTRTQVKFLGYFAFFIELIKIALFPQLLRLCLHLAVQPNEEPALLFLAALTLEVSKDLGEIMGVGIEL